MLEDVAHGHYGTGLISRATAEMLREKHVRRRAGVAWGTRRLVEALPVPKSESAPKSDSKSNSAPASSSPAARSDEEVDRGAKRRSRRRSDGSNREGPGRRSALTFHSVTGWVADPGDVSANSTCAAVYRLRRRSAQAPAPTSPLPPIPTRIHCHQFEPLPYEAEPRSGLSRARHGGSGLGERPRRGRS